MADPVKVRFRRLAHGAGLALPSAASAGSAGLDLRAAAAAELAPGDRLLVPTGFAIELPAGYEGQVRPRSGLAARHGVTVVNAPGTIDSDYRGELKVALVNLGREAYRLRRGERVAQLVVAPVARVVVEEADELGPTARGAGGFGSTGRG